MNVNELRDRIMELSHQTEDDQEVTGKALGWLNAAYHELMDGVVAYLPPAMQVLENVQTAGDGSATLAKGPYRVLRVVDRDAGSTLEIVSPSVVLDVDPSGTATGAPVRCMVNDGVVKVHPAGSVNLSVLYIPLVEDLASGGEEDSILLPKAHHHVLVWGGMVWSSLFERGFSSQGELLIYQRNWEAAKERVKLSMLVASNETLHVQPFEIV